MIVGACLILAVSSICHGAVKTESISYTDGKQALQGYMVYEDKFQEKRPGVMVVHQWMGITDYEKQRAEDLAKKGFVVLVADMYGKGIRPKTVEAAAKQSGIYKKDRELMRRRANAGLTALKNSPRVNASLTAAVGYCFGGGVVLELSRSGADLKGVVSVHGNLDTPTSNTVSPITAEILVLHGADDPYVPWEHVSAFRKEMQDKHTQWELAVFGNAVHAFSQKESGNDPSKGFAYNEAADKESWTLTRKFLERLLQRRLEATPIPLSTPTL